MITVISGDDSKSLDEMNLTQIQICDFSLNLYLAGAIFPLLPMKLTLWLFLVMWKVVKSTHHSFYCSFSAKSPDSFCLIRGLWIVKRFSYKDISVIVVISANKYSYCSHRCPKQKWYAYLSCMQAHVPLRIYAATRKVNKKIQYDAAIKSRKT